MAIKQTREQLRQKRINTRNTMDAAREYCERHGYQMPLEYLLAVGNGKDPRTGPDVSFDLDNLDAEGGITITESTKAMSEAAKYIYVPASRLEVDAEERIQIAPVQVNEKVAASLVQKLQKLGIGNTPADE